MAICGDVCSYRIGYGAIFNHVNPRFSAIRLADALTRFGGAYMDHIGVAKRKAELPPRSVAPCSGHKQPWQQLWESVVLDMLI